MVIEIKDGKQVREERARAAQALARTAAHESAKEPEITQSSPAAVQGLWRAILLKAAVQRMLPWPIRSVKRTTSV